MIIFLSILYLRTIKTSHFSWKIWRIYRESTKPIYTPNWKELLSLLNYRNTSLLWKGDLAEISCWKSVLARIVSGIGHRLPNSAVGPMRYMRSLVQWKGAFYFEIKLFRVWDMTIHWENGLYISYLWRSGPKRRPGNWDRRVHGFFYFF